MASPDAESTSLLIESDIRCSLISVILNLKANFVSVGGSDIGKFIKEKVKKK